MGSRGLLGVVGVFKANGGQQTSAGSTEGPVESRGG